ncbi:hypothetical protein [Bradyrhizobium uaiense]|uniref:Uncharacterized protein n=1 Tax=Bradyrhizobium uaiense TaxID=2594946 RepID=A0A6P1B9W4_9BRAD|nr:hypothetical protein [Bradyrhizobium uaiense]NEU95246.1 hypothetical protein [Bradyrhizobium uaiense]
MRFTSTIVVACLSGALLLQGSWAFADPQTDEGKTVFGNAPIGHLQPRARPFSPDSSADQAEQRRESDFDVKERKLDEEFNKKLDICRC